MKTPSGDLLFYAGLLLCGGIYTAIRLPTTAPEFQVVSGTLAACLVIEAVLLLVRYRWSPEFFVVIFVFLLGFALVRIATDGFTGSRIGMTAAAVAALFAYPVLRREVRGLAAPGGEPSATPDQPQPMAGEAQDDWEGWWDARVTAIEGVLGKSTGIVGHSPIPFHLGVEASGAADVIYFRNHVPGTVAVTSDLIGCDEQVLNQLGNYELMICQRDDAKWGAGIIRRLAHYTLQAELNPGETMDIGPATPDGSTIAAFLFFDGGRFEVRGRKAGLLLCVGITADELEACRGGRRTEVEAALNSAGVYPYTDLFRRSVMGG